MDDPRKLAHAFANDWDHHPERPCDSECSHGAYCNELTSAIVRAVDGALARAELLVRDSYANTGWSTTRDLINAIAAERARLKGTP